MAQTSAVQVNPASERTPVPVRLRWAFHRSRAAVPPRRWAIPWEIRDNGRYYARARTEAKARKASADDMQGLEAEAAHSYWELEEELAMLESNRLLRQADKYMLPKPKFRGGDPIDDRYWRQGTAFKPTWYLKPQAMQELRKQIRAEQKARREPLGEWVKIVGATIGGLGGAAYLVQEVIKLLH
jgi:hypothetical protein